MRKSSTIFRIVERISLSLGVFLLACCVFSRLQGAVRAADDAKANSEAANTVAAPTVEPWSEQVDFSLWSVDRIKAFKDSWKQISGPPLAVLRIPRLHIVAPVLEGLGDLALNGGVGRIPGTAHPGEQGNIGIAGHRDGFFRRLKDIVRGDRIQLETSGKTEVYVVDKVAITNPQNVDVLRARATPSVTLVTCYPFYVKGAARQRYIVQASLQQHSSRGF